MRRFASSQFNVLGVRGNATAAWRCVRAACAMVAILAAVPGALAQRPSHPAPGEVAADAGAGVARLAPIHQLVVQAPSMRAAAQRWQAARAREDAAGEWADPEIEAMAMRRAEPMDDDMDMWELNLRQPLPKRGERSASRALARANAQMAEAEYAVQLGELASDVAMSLAEIEAGEARLELLKTEQARLQSVLRAIEARLATGGSVRLADRLSVQTRSASLELSIEEVLRELGDARAELESRLGLPAGAPLPPFAAPEIEDIVAENAAAVHEAQARQAEADAMIRMAQASARPMTAVGLRLERERSSMGDVDTVGIGFMSEIPWRSRRVARAEVRAAQAERTAASSDRTAALFRISNAQARVRRAERLAAVSRELAGSTRSRLDAEYDSLLRSASAGAGSGESTVLQMIELLEDVNAAERQTIDAELAIRTARAELWRYLALNLQPVQPSPELP